MAESGTDFRAPGDSPLQRHKHAIVGSTFMRSRAVGDGDDGAAPTLGVRAGVRTASESPRLSPPPKSPVPRAELLGVVEAHAWVVVLAVTAVGMVDGQHHAVDPGPGGGGFGVRQDDLAVGIRVPWLRQLFFARWGAPRCNSDPWVADPRAPDGVDEIVAVGGEADGGRVVRKLRRGRTTPAC